ncbi:MAG: Lrp/AsnC ligand binding domain-containing protein [archaeon GB-1867-097]|nr:Lrp/AsnC ligand binding domain-containing protein [Candidatus Verstraetearchaeota archaeon]MCS7373968.1 Lrp/AsnC ligand binding domain-containing protein [Candidatus Culexmicrobium thermophilum]MCS7384568.1 Lrp/AsnC ligand binding domain-containing protein [Candidatus Culexmicrobium thermophilum]HDO20280.1 Lrp/AsnC family transcriptional regulator [Candidatus Bathyarchaeota archaeon]
MPEAFVLINTQIGGEHEVLRRILKVDEVDQAYLVYGVYDIVAKVKAETMEKLRDAITWKIRKMDKVMSTITMIVIEGHRKGN